LREAAGVAITYGTVMWLDQAFGFVTEHSAFRIAFRATFFGLFITLVLRSGRNSHWKDLFYTSGEGKLIESPPPDCAYQLVSGGGIVFFHAVGLRFVPKKRFWRKPSAVELSPLESVTATRINSPVANWMGHISDAWTMKPIEITSNTGRVMIEVPDPNEALLQIGRAVETLGARPR